MTSITVGKITIYCGEALSVVERFPDELFDAIITDPPETVRTSWLLPPQLLRVLKTAGVALTMTNPKPGWIKTPKANVISSWTEFDPRFTPCAEYGHPHSRPIEAVRQLVAMTTGAILDPYCGAGSTLVAAVMADRYAVGIEINPDYFAACVERVREATRKCYVPLY